MPKYSASFNRIVARLQSCLRLFYWPPPDDEYWGGAAAQIGRSGLEEADFIDAIAEMQVAPPKLEKVLPELLRLAKIAHVNRGHNRPDDLTNAEAWSRSRDCADCRGMGLATRYRRNSAGKLDAQGRPVAPSITLYCRCALGRWLKATHKRNCILPFADLEENVFLWGEEYRTPPELAEVPPVQPAEPEQLAAPRIWRTEEVA